MADIVVIPDAAHYIVMAQSASSGGGDGNGITAITQPSNLVMRVATRDLSPVDIALFQGPQGQAGTNGTNGLDGPSSLLPFINKQSFVDHLMPIGIATAGLTSNFQAVVRSGTGTAAFRNDFTIGLGGQIRLNTLTSAATDLVIRSGAGLSGNRIGTTPVDYIFCFYANTLQTATESAVFRLCAQNEVSASVTTTNRTGFYVDFAWQTDGVKATFSCFNGTGSGGALSTVITDTLAIAINTLYAVRVRVSSTTAQLYINGVLRQTINTNLPIFAPIQTSVALTKTSGTGSVSYTVDAIAIEATASLNTYTL